MMYNGLYDIKVLEKNLQDRIVKNYEIAANRAKIGHVGSDCFWVRQALANMVKEAIVFSPFFSCNTRSSLNALYFKLNT